MSKTEWTVEQQKAIEARGMQVLVSAAAGSGKTAVLTERVKNIVSDINNPCSVSEILVVTFTRAAAGEMRDRIYKALKETADSGNNVNYLREQMASLPLADICTMDSFCQKLVKENFTKANVSVDYSVLDDKDLSEMTNDAIEEVINKLYEENDDSFIKLTSMFLSERDDSRLGEVVHSLYKDSRSYPSPKLWLESVVDSFSEDKTPNDTVWADIIYKDIRLFADFHHKRLLKAVSLLEESGGFNPNFVNKFIVNAERLQQLIECIDKRNWDGMVSMIREGILFTCDGRNTKVNNYIKDLATEAFKVYKADLESIEALDLPTEAEHKADSLKLKPIIKKLCDAVIMLEETLDEMKKERNAYAFDDILHKSIDLLVEFKGEGWEPTPLALSLQNKYKEIFIDEYQDTNQAQNIIFEAVSRNCNNLYCVGDVKQSIYKFRLASPQLFMALKKRLPDYDGGNHPSQIRLDRNFRSRKGIADATNHIFTTVMSEDVGEIDYNKKEELVFGASYFEDKPEPDVELLCFDFSEHNSAETVCLEAEQIALYIKDLLKSKVLITTKTGKRPVESSDICILLRNMKKKAHVYAQALTEEGISSNTVLDGDTSLSKEIQLLMSLVKVVNNPLVDIPLISVLFSPLFGFTADELSEIRMVNSNAELFVCLEEYAKTSEKAKHFLDKLQLYRNIAASYPINEFVKFIVRDTDIINVFLAAEDGRNRSSNIRGFMDFADSFTESGRVGLGAFVRSMDSAVNSQKMHTYSGVTSPGGVQIMSIHKSKGLEFPYVIVADCSADFNKRDAYNPLKISRNTGIGLKIRDDENFTTYNTVSSVATEKDILYGGASEELRVLYVAMTRAKEHLVFVCSFKNRDGLKKKIRVNNHLGFDANGKLHPYAVYKAKSMTEWLLTCFSKHSMCDIVRKQCEIINPESITSEYPMNVSSEREIIEISLGEHNDVVFDVDEDIISQLEERANFVYKYDCSGILAKRTASSTERHLDERKYFARRKPKFLAKSFTGADRGTAIHKFLELCDFKNASSNLEEEKKRLFSNGLVTEKELSVLDNSSVEAFFNSDIGKRLVASENIHKEFEFSFLKKAGELYKDISQEIYDEEIVVQGKFDCAFIENGEAVLIDYKSDNITEPEVFKGIYAPQLEIYSQALTACMGVPVKEKYIYSFKLKAFIKI